MQDIMDRVQFWQEWPIAGPWHLFPLSGGTNNQVWRVETLDGKHYVLRLFADLSWLPRLRSEAALLTALAEQDLPFQVPAPIQTRNGEGLAFLEQEGKALA